MARHNASANTPAEAVVAEYLDRLRRAAADLPEGPRAELLDNISAHLSETTGDASEAQVRTVLDELGSPEEIAAAARAESGSRPDRSGDGMFYDIAAVLVLLLGGFVVPVVGWLAGVVMLCAGPRWSTSQKVLGTLAWPVAACVGGTVLFVSPNQSVTVLGLSALVVVIGLPAVFIHLLRSANRKRA